MKRLFYFTGYRLSVMHWRGRTLAGTTSFEPTESGLERFRNYLLETENIPGKFLVDVIEEDFRNERVPHVGAKDRVAVVNRLLDRYYRASHDYSYSEIIGREKEGRKDDIVLLGAMTNPQLIQPWISIIEECEVPLSGIWTLPIVSKGLLRDIRATSGPVLLVSQQVNSNVRQTLFRDGKLISSRQSIINQDQNDISSTGELAAPEVSRTMDYLRAQGLIGTEELVNLHVLGSAEQIDSLNTYFVSGDRQKVFIHSIEDLLARLKLRGVKEKFSDGLFAWLCVRQGIAPSHYGKSERFSRYHNRVMAGALYAASLLVLVVGVLMTEVNVSGALEHERSIDLLKQQESNYRSLYSKKFKDFEGVFENAGVMNAAVDLADRIRINGATSPLDFMISLSRILSQDKKRGLHIDKIEWLAVNPDERKGGYRNANFTSADEVRHDAIISGRIQEPEYNYRASVEHIQKVIDYLKASPRVAEVEVLRMPVDLRPDSNFTSQTGAELKEKDASVSGMFSLRVIMGAPDRV